MSNYFIVSRKDDLPRAASEMANTLFYNMWTKRMNPYNDLEIGDTLFWLETKTNTFIWESELVKVDRFEYPNKIFAEQRLGTSKDDEYFQDAPSQGYCLVYQVKPHGMLNLERPAGIKLNRNGWLKIDEKTAGNLLGHNKPITKGSK